MFWKKKNDDVTIEFDESDRRRHVRITPVEPLYLESGTQKFAVLDISSTGLAFHSPTLAGKNTLDIVLHLPKHHSITGEPVSLECTVKILHTVKGTFHCRFLELDRESQYQLDHYILSEQKKQIRSRKQEDSQ